MSKRLLIVDDEEAISWSLSRAFEREGYKVQSAASAEQGLAALNTFTPDAAILDVRLPGMDGLTAFSKLRERFPGLPVLVITAFGNLDTAVRAISGGAAEYLVKPFDLQQAIDAISRALDSTLTADVGEPEVKIAEEIVGQSAPLQAVFKRIALAAPRDTCVLITGESGTGKELVARAIHRHSARSGGPFLPVHAASLNPNLVESELFGHVKGAYTGATSNRDGLLKLADGGTVLLDEIGDVPHPLQVKLLRALETGEVLPVGANRPQTLNLRLLAATHQDLGRLVAEGKFREDLFFRLNVFSIHLPPLRERREDIPLLVEFFLRQFAPQSLPLPAETMAFLQEQPWPGNVRELRNALEHAAIVAHGGAIGPEFFPSPVVRGQVSKTEMLATAVRDWAAERIDRHDPATLNLYEQFLRAVEPALLDEVLKRVRGNRWEAGRWLGLNRATVRKKLGEYGMEDDHRDDRS